jgi:hypothetical protein
MHTINPSCSTNERVSDVNAVRWRRSDAVSVLCMWFQDSSLFLVTNGLDEGIEGSPLLFGEMAQ